MNTNKLAKILLRVGLAFVFVYAAVEIYFRPDNFLKYVPHFVLDVMPLGLFLDTFGVAEIILSIWLLSGWKGEYPSFISFALMFGIIVLNPDYFQVLFRNVAIGLGSLSLLLLEREQETPAKLLPGRLKAKSKEYFLNRPSKIKHFQNLFPKTAFQIGGKS